MIRGRLIGMLVVACVLQAVSASANQDDGLWEHLSGPGPFIRFPSFQARVVCITRVGNDNYTVALPPWGRGSTTEFGHRPVPAPAAPSPEQTAKLQCSRDENVLGYVSVAYGHYFSLENNLFPNNLTDDQFKVKAESLSVRFMGRTLNDVVDIGFGLDMFMFHGKAFDKFTRFAVQPVRLSVAPFAAVRNSARSRAFHLTIAPTIFLGRFDQDDFCNSSGCTAVPRQFSSKLETLWATSVEIDILTLIRGD